MTTNSPESIQLTLDQALQAIPKPTPESSIVEEVPSIRQPGQIVIQMGGRVVYAFPPDDPSEMYHRR